MIQIKFTDDAGVPFLREYVLEILERNFPGQIEESDTPDFLFCSVFGHEYLKYDCVRILYTGENLVPDFNIFDYAIGFSHLDFEDRYLRMPIYFFYDEYKEALKKHEISEGELSRKQKFCNFVYSNDGGAPQREKFFNLLSNYRKVDSGGRWLNNIGGPVEDKLEFQRDYRFSIAFENSSTSGYTTEKIVQAFAAKTIPIYWGDPQIGKEFNEKAFINCHAYPSFEAVVEEIKKIDSDEEAFRAYLHEPICAEPYEKMQSDLEDFVVAICRQQPKEAFRRSNLHWGLRYQIQLRNLFYIADTTRKERMKNRILRMLKRER